MANPQQQAFAAFGRLMRSLFRHGTEGLPEIRRAESRVARFAGPKHRYVPQRRSGR